MVNECRPAPATLDMMVWDIMGEKGFRALLRDAYFEGSHGVVFPAALPALE